MTSLVPFGNMRFQRSAPGVTSREQVQSDYSNEGTMARSYGFIPSQSFLQRQAQDNAFYSQPPTQRGTSSQVRAQTPVIRTGGEYPTRPARPSAAQPTPTVSQGTPYSPTQQPESAYRPAEPTITRIDGRTMTLRDYAGMIGMSNSPNDLRRNAVSAEFSRLVDNQAAGRGQYVDPVAQAQEAQRRMQMEALGQQYRNLTKEQSDALRASPEDQRNLQALREYRNTGRIPAGFDPGGGEFGGQPYRPGAAQPMQPDSFGTPYSPSGPRVGGWPDASPPGAGGQSTSVRWQDPATGTPIIAADRGVDWRAQGSGRQSGGMGYGNPYGGGMPAQQQGGDPVSQLANLYQQQMTAWAQPKQQLLQWGQQMSQVPWGPNYGNTPENRPAPWSQQVSGMFGNNQQDMWNNMGGFVQAVNNQAMQRPVGTYLGQGNPGPNYGRQNYDPSLMMQNAQQLLGSGWQNPFATPMQQMPQWQQPYGGYGAAR